MNDDPNIQFLAARSRKRSHREMSDLPYRNQSPWDHQGEAFRSTNTPLFPHQFLQPGRYPGDGFDYRRPVMSATSSHVDEVIDLTNEPDSPPAQRSRSHGSGFRPPHNSRPPRFGRNIMADVVDLEDGEQNPAGIPEVQFIRATVRPDQSSARDHRFVDGSNLLDFLRLHPHRFSTASLGEEAIRQEVALHRHLMTPYQHAVEPLWIDPPEGFNPDLSSLSPPRPAPSYKPPSPAPEGFTRSAQDDEVVVCPNCEHELGTGDDVRQQIWVAKPCGHVYCGECAKNRSLSKAKKVSQRTSNPFSKCLVDNCGKLVSAPKSMFQIYL